MGKTDEESRARRSPQRTTIRYGALPHLLFWRRKLCGLSQTGAAKKLGLSLTQLSNLEAGLRVPSVKHLDRFCDYLELNRENLQLLRAASIVDRLLDDPRFEDVRPRVVRVIENEINAAVPMKVRGLSRHRLARRMGGFRTIGRPATGKAMA